ncbi:MAG: glycosyltransferase [Saprospirales bacterium]|nr:glycosyltransferase [Saprospirales bacterium]
MNWAYHLIKALPGIKTTIAAPLIIENAFSDSSFHYLWSPIQWQRNVGEWSISDVQQKTAQLFFQKIPLYQEYVFHQLKRNKPDLLHAHFANVAWQYLPIARRLCLPLVVSFYGYDYEQLPVRKPVFNHRYQILFQSAKAILVEGPHGRSTLEKQGCPPEKIHILPLGINLDQIPVHPRVKKSGQLNLIQAATFTEKKGHRYTLEAFRLALPHCPNLHLTLVGEPRDPSILRDVKEFITSNRLENYITLLDFVPFDKFHFWLKDFHVFIQPSCYASDLDCEGGAPVVLLDAQATGMPVISTTHCDIPSEVIHGQTGYLASEKDSKMLATHIKTFYEMDNTLYQNFSAAAGTT